MLYARIPVLTTHPFFPPANAELKLPTYYALITTGSMPYPANTLPLEHAAMTGDFLLRLLPVGASAVTDL